VVFLRPVALRAPLFLRAEDERFAAAFLIAIR
jgi:hypothetical protein